MKKSLGAKITVIFLLAVLSTSGLLSFILYMQSYNMVSSEIFNQINVEIRDMINKVDGISNDLKEIAENSSKVTVGIEQIASIAEQNSAGIEETASAAQQHNDFIKHLSDYANIMSNLASQLND